MGDWIFLEKLLDQAQHQLTVIGKIWLMVLFIFRLLILSLAAESVWGDEQADFICNTKQPGCDNICYDKAFPISHIRYWVLQFVFVSTPTLVYLGHVVHISRKEEKQRNIENDMRIFNDKVQQTHHVVPGSEKKISEKQTVKVKGTLMCTYIASIILKIILEAGFLLGQWNLYGFVMPYVYECEKFPCLQTVDCYISRPTEKTIFIIFMLGASLLSLTLNVFELAHLLVKRIFCKAQVNNYASYQYSNELVTISNKSSSPISDPVHGKTCMCFPNKNLHPQCSAYKMTHQQNWISYKTEKQLAFNVAVQPDVDQILISDLSLPAPVKPGWSAPKKQFI